MTGDTEHPAGGMPESTEPLWQLSAQGQSVWLDYIRREILENGELERMIRECAVHGVTSNPAIFEQAIARSDDYDPALSVLAARGATPLEAYESLAIDDIQRAADLFRGIYDQTGGGDGYVSLEVSPELANDTEATIAEARRLWTAVARPNVMIKVPGTDAGVPAIEELLAEGLNVNITLLFSLAAYEKVMQAYLKALERRVAAGEPVSRVASVASFFVSRVDSAVDAELEARIEEASDEAEKERLRALLGRTAIANAQVAYERFGQAFSGERWERLAAAGARVQRPLWASTSTKNPAYRDVIYVEELIGPDTVNTMPLQTVEAFADHGVVRRTVDANVAGAHAELKQLADAGIDLERVTDELLDEAIEKFVTPFRSLLASIEEKMAQVGQE